METVFRSPRFRETIVALHDRCMCLCARMSVGVFAFGGCSATFDGKLIIRHNNLGSKSGFCYCTLFDFYCCTAAVGVLRRVFGSGA